MTFRLTIATLVLSAIAIVPLGACSSLADECAQATPAANGACSNEGLQCPFELQQPNCDGTFTTIESSCTCSESAWSCPSPVDCAQTGGDDAASE